MYDEIGDSLPHASSEFNERKFQFILNYCLAERASDGASSNLHYDHNRQDLIDCAGELYEKALEKCQ
jgi:hypothetical protein